MTALEATVEIVKSALNGSENGIECILRSDARGTLIAGIKDIYATIQTLASDDK